MAPRRQVSARSSRGPLTARRPSRAVHHGACGPEPAMRSRRWRRGSVGPPDPPARGCPDLVKPEFLADIGVRMPHQRRDTDARACSLVRPARFPAADEPPRCAGSDSEPSESPPMPTGRWRASRSRSGSSLRAANPSPAPNNPTGRRGKRGSPCARRARSRAAKEPTCVSPPRAANEAPRDASGRRGPDVAARAPKVPATILTRPSRSRHRRSPYAQSTSDYSRDP